MCYVIVLIHYNISKNNLFCVDHRIIQCFYVAELHLLFLGWLFKIELKNLDELKTLMDEDAYQSFIKAQTHD